MNDKGRAGEDWAARFLMLQGLVVEARNYRCRWGEIDLVVRQADLWIFVEVRWRQRPCPRLVESVTPAKQQRWWLASQHYLSHQKNGDNPLCRFDLMILEGHPFLCTTWLHGVLPESGFSRGNC